MAERPEQDSRWKQRFQHFSRAQQALNEAVVLRESRARSIQAGPDSGWRHLDAKNCENGSDIDLTLMRSTETSPDSSQLCVSRYNNRSIFADWPGCSASFDLPPQRTDP